MRICCWLLACLCHFLPLAAQDIKLDTGTFVSFDRTKIYYEACEMPRGGTGRAVILIHGFISSSESWKRTVLYSGLVSADFRPILLDLRGNGKSARPHEPEAFENDAEAKDVMILADKLGIDRYVVVGYSRGAIIASRVALLDKRVTGLVMGGMGSDFTNPRWPRRRKIYRALIGKSEPEFEGLVNRVKSNPDLDQLCLAYMQKSQPVTSPAEFGGLRVPTLVICGDKDEDNGSSKDLSEMIPNSSYLRVPGVHNDTMRSKYFCDGVMRFLENPAVGGNVIR